jgi:hypothetical protein
MLTPKVTPIRHMGPSPYAPLVRPVLKQQLR